MPLNDPLLPDAGPSHGDAPARVLDRKGRALMAQTRGVAVLFLILGTGQVTFGVAGLFGGDRWQTIQLVVGVVWLVVGFQWFVARRRQQRSTT